MARGAKIDVLCAVRGNQIPWTMDHGARVSAVRGIRVRLLESRVWQRVEHQAGARELGVTNWTFNLGAPLGFLYLTSISRIRGFQPEVEDRPHIDTSPGDRTGTAQSSVQSNSWSSRLFEISPWSPPPTPSTDGDGVSITRYRSLTGRRTRRGRLRVYYIRIRRVRAHSMSASPHLHRSRLQNAVRWPGSEFARHGDSSRNDLRRGLQIGILWKADSVCRRSVTRPRRESWMKKHEEAGFGFTSRDQSDCRTCRKVESGRPMAQGVCPTLHTESYLCCTSVNCTSIGYLTKHRASSTEQERERA